MELVYENNYNLTVHNFLVCLLVVSNAIPLEDSS
jgi:hypothetical protein